MIHDTHIEKEWSKDSRMQHITDTVDRLATELVDGYTDSSGEVHLGGRFYNRPDWNLQRTPLLPISTDVRAGLLTKDGESPVQVVDSLYHISGPDGVDRGAQGYMIDGGRISFFRDSEREGFVSETYSVGSEDESQAFEHVIQALDRLEKQGRTEDSKDEVQRKDKPTLRQILGRVASLLRS